jgi:hypothetical protein
MRPSMCPGRNLPIWWKHALANMTRKSLHLKTGSFCGGDRTALENPSPPRALSL